MVSLRRVLVASVGSLAGIAAFYFCPSRWSRRFAPADRVRFGTEGLAATKADEVDYETRTDKGDHPTPRALGGQGAGLRSPADDDGA